MVAYVGVVEGITITSIVALFALYLRWLRVVEPVHDRKERIRNVLKDERFVIDNVSFKVERVSIREEDSYTHQITKRMLVFRNLRGECHISLRACPGEVTLRADGIGFEEYFWTRQSINEYLQDEYPDVEHISTTPVQGTTETKIVVRSLSVEEIQATLERVPEYMNRELIEYPGDARFSSDMPQNR